MAGGYGLACAGQAKFYMYLPPTEFFKVQADLQLHFVFKPPEEFLKSISSAQACAFAGTAEGHERRESRAGQFEARAQK